MIKLNGEYIASLRNKPQMLLEDLQQSKITKQDAIIAVGMLLYGKGEDALFKRASFRDFWRSRIGGRKSFAAATQNTELSAEETAYVKHMHKVADRLRRLPAFDGCWEQLKDHTAFKVAKALAPEEQTLASGAEIEDEPDRTVPAADLALRRGVFITPAVRNMSSGEVTRATTRAGITPRPYNPKM